jgi:hypothetical protein
MVVVQYFLTANFRIRFGTGHWFVDPCLTTYIQEEHVEWNGFLHSIRNLSSYHVNNSILFSFTQLFLFEAITY